MRWTSPASLAAVLLGGCLFESDSTLHSLDVLWPNADHMRWDFQLVRRAWVDEGPTTYATPAEVPPCPSVRDLAAIIDSQPIGQITQVDTTGWSFWFDGTVATESGAVGQRVIAVIVPAGPIVRASSSGAELWRRLAIARPDLRDGLARAHPEWTAVRDVTESQPLLLDGYAFEKTTGYVGGYGDLDRNLSWLYLEAPIRVDHEFAIQLVAALADDVFLHGLILPERTVRTPSGPFRAAVCLYVIDYGVGNFADAQGHPTGYTRFYDYGLVAYAPEVGPVYSYERRFQTVGPTPSIGAGDLTLSLRPTQTLAW